MEDGGREGSGRAVSAGWLCGGRLQRTPSKVTSREASSLSRAQFLSGSMDRTLVTATESVVTKFESRKIKSLQRNVSQGHTKHYFY